MDRSLMEKLNNLPEAVKNQLSSPAFLTVLSNLEQIYNIKPALMMIRLVVGDLTPNMLSSELQKENPALAPQQLDSIQKSFTELLSKLPPITSRPRPVSASVSYQAPSAVATPVTPPVSVPPVVTRPRPAATFVASVQPSANPTSELTFSSEDEEEIRQYASLGHQPSSSTDFIGQADAIIAKLGYNNKDGDLNKRLQNIVVSSIKGVRDSLDVREILLKSKETGGMGFDQAMAEKLLQLIVGENQNVSIKSAVSATSPAPAATPAVVSPVTPKSSLPPVTPPSPSKAAPPSIAKTIMTGSGPVIEEEDGLPVVRMPEELMVAPQILGVAKNIPKSSAAKTDNIKTANSDNYISGKHLPGTTAYRTINKDESVASDNPRPTAPKPEPYISANRPATAKFFNQQSSRRPSLDDVKFTKKLIGPIEELENMTLIDFRRLGTKPEDISEKIKEKIDLLEKEHYGKRLQGIDAWYKNEVNRFYRLLGHSSMETGKTIKQVIEERIAGGKPTLSLAEFEAVMELNRDLRY